MCVSDQVGFFGVLIVLIAYFLLQKGILQVYSPWFSLINALGSVLILYSLIFSFNLPAFVIEASWLVISLYGFYKYKYRKPKIIKNENPDI